MFGYKPMFSDGPRYIWFICPQKKPYFLCYNIKIQLKRCSDPWFWNHFGGPQFQQLCPFTFDQLFEFLAQQPLKFPSKYTFLWSFLTINVQGILILLQPTYNNVLVLAHVYLMRRNMWLITLSHCQICIWSLSCIMSSETRNYFLNSSLVCRPTWF